MIATLRLLPLLIRRAPRQAASAIALCAAGVTAAMLIASVVIAAWAGLGARQERLTWREPAPATDAPAALQRRSTDLFDGRRIDVVELAPLGDDAAALAAVPTPPGLRTAPAPGATYLSPALAELVGSEPEAGLGARFGAIAGTIGPAGLTRPDELVVIRGVAAGSLGEPVAEADISLYRMPATPSDVVAVSGFDTTRADRDLTLYRDLALVAVVLVAVPALLLIGSAARLTAARREQRLAAIRLTGATPGAVRALAAAETAIGAVIGAVVGVGAAALVTPLLDGMEMAGGRWFPGDLRLTPLVSLALVACAIAICVGAAVLSLRRVSTAPLGVSRSAEPQRARWPRLLGSVAAILALGVASATAADGGSTLSMIAALGVVIASLALVGPWITSLVGRLMVLASRRAPMLIAGRRIVDDPRAAYRVVASVVLTGMVTGFLAGVMPSAEAQVTGGSGAGEFVIVAPVARLGDLARLGDQIASEFPGTTLDIDEAPSAGDGSTAVEVVEVPGHLGPNVSIDELRTMTAEVREGQPLIGGDDDIWGDQMFLDDVRRASLAILVAGLLLAASSSTVAAAASVIDQRRTIGRLALTGMPVGELQRARRWQNVAPLVAATIGAIGLGLISATLMMLGFGVAEENIVGPEAVQLLAVVAGATLLGLLSATITRPMLSNAARSGTTDAG